ncbi:photosynthetic reaction center cytochrome PufC [Salinarimonas soli]|uniref:Photosynthetic reaction center cytochrome c subunit n=1 Tax=Salinarimonas soli TaxID=1638099 RepID=A0A5B2VGN3_9HYPH|nr:photosynthetic reaction center cytochrome PufC [Salinarimonas soli]KAA2238075.1 photosynthetic reaction center cytochrome c subunit [Salinarimonas soli]
MSEGRKNVQFWLMIGGAAAAVAGVGLAFTFQSPRTVSVQEGYRGIAMEQVYHRVAVANVAASNKVPEAQPAVDPAGVPSKEAYQNVQVLGDVDANEFIRVMTAMTEWVAPEQGCTYCHAEGEELSSDKLYTKRVARRMLQMTQHINADWKPHVGGTGVTCYTCHRGQPVPQNIWFAPPQDPNGPRMVGNDAGQNQPAKAAGLASLPYDPFSPYLAGDPANIRVISKAALPDRTNPADIKQAEHTYSLMLHMSNSLGVNCTFCHNSRAFFDWNQSPPQRTTSWYGIRMVRDLTVNYLAPLRPEFPHERLGPMGDSAKANCATCHQGANKPLLGVSMLKDYPVLAGPTAGDRRTGEE